MDYSDVIVVRPPAIARWPETNIYEAVCATGGGLRLLGEPANYAEDYTPKAVSDAMVAFTNKLATVSLPTDRRLPFLFIEGLSAQPAHLRTIASLLGIQPPLISGLVHGGSFIPGDKRLAMHDKAEALVFANLDLAIVPSQWHAELQKEKYPDVPTAVVRWPLSEDLLTAADAATKNPKVRATRLVFPHRELPEKGVELFREVELSRPEGWTLSYSKRNPDLRSQTAFYDYLSLSKAVFANATMETYGVAIEEAMALGCCPVLNHHPVYDELYENNNVHWHDGTVEGVRAALSEVETCDGYHYPISASESHARAMRILYLARTGEAS